MPTDRCKPFICHNPFLECISQLNSPLADFGLLTYFIKVCAIAYAKHKALAELSLSSNMPTNLETFPDIVFTHVILVKQVQLVAIAPWFQILIIVRRTGWQISVIVIIRVVKVKLLLTPSIISQVQSQIRHDRNRTVGNIKLIHQVNRNLQRQQMGINIHIFIGTFV